MTTASQLKRGALGAVVGIVAGSLLFGSTAPAHAADPAAATPPAASAATITHPDLDWAGSQVRRHEPATTTARFAPNAVQTPGLDVSGYQGNVDWAAVAAAGARFAYVKATEATTYTNPSFPQQYAGALAAGLIRGAYHFALPNTSGGATQADYFVDHGGGWAPGGQTLPGMLDLEWNPYGPACYGLSPDRMVAWIAAFSAEYRARTGRWPVIYTATTWWNQCTGNLADRSADSPLMVARYNTTVGTLPYHWAYYTIWQYADTGPLPGDQDTFNGTVSQLARVAAG